MQHHAFTTAPATTAAATHAVAILTRLALSLVFKASLADLIANQLPIIANGDVNSKA